MNSTQIKAAPAQTISMIGAQQNDLLRALSREDLIALFADLELVTLPAGKHLFDFGDQVEYSYFRPTPSCRCNI